MYLNPKAEGNGSQGRGKSRVYTYNGKVGNTIETCYKNVHIHPILVVEMKELVLMLILHVLMQKNIKENQW